MGKTIKVSDQVYETLKARSKATGVPISDLVTETGEQVTAPSKTVTIEPEELCWTCQNKVKDRLLKDAKVTVGKNGTSGGDLGWVMVALLVFGWLQKQRQPGQPVTSQEQQVTSS